MGREGEHHSGSFMLGLLIGGLGAAAASLLLAPQSGERTREQIREKAAEARANAEARAAEVAEMAERVQSQALVALEEGQKQLMKAIEETRAAVEAAGTPPVLAPTRETELADAGEATVGAT